MPDLITVTETLHLRVDRAFRLHLLRSDGEPGELRAGLGGHQGNGNADGGVKGD